MLNFQRGFDITRKTQASGGVPVVSSGGIASFHDTAAAAGPGVVIGRKGTLGKVFYLPGHYWPHDTTLWVQDFKSNLPRFVYYFMKQFDTSWLDAGSANPTLNRNHLHPLRVSWPAIHVQQAVAEVLGALDDKIAANTKLAAAADELLATRLSAFIQHDTKQVPLGEIAQVNASKVKPIPGTGLRYIDIAAVGVGSFDFPDITLWDDAPSRARRGVQRGDTLWSTVRPNRRSHALNLSEDPLLVASTGFAVLSPRTVGWAYLYELTRRPEFTAYLETVAEGSAYPAVRAERFGEALVPLISGPSRNLFESIAEPLRETAHMLITENRTLAATRDALLPQLMSGKLRVKDAEKALEDAGV
ncbi:restriction endonuclease subunit S [Arthrobacter echini]|uniref:restriction endonuclease subunit S n=1 Tax=Arthrobacter echini TaxID=1529066 RepID=UPI0016525D9E|nr:restriction endonuclease subunit S [Arthrobacter echini]